MKIKILLLLTGFLLSAVYASAATYSQASISTMIPSPKARFLQVDTEKIKFTPLTAMPNPCASATLYYDDISDEIRVCDGTGSNYSLTPWYTENGITQLRNQNDKIMNTTPYIGLNKGFSINEGTLAVARIGLPTNTNSTTDLAILGRGNTGLLYNPTNGSLRVGTNVLIGSLGAYNPHSVVFGGEILTDPAAQFISVLGGLNHAITGNIYGAVIAGGDRNAISASTSMIGSGLLNTVTGTGSFIGSGQQNRILNPATHGFIGGGAENTIDTETHSAIVGGYQNSVSPRFGFIGGGTNNRILGAVMADGGAGAVIAGGKDNTITADYAAIAGGRGNSASGEHSFTAGYQNSISGGNSAALGNNNSVGGTSSVSLGNNNSVNASNSFAVGNGANVTAPNRVVFNNVRVAIGHNDATEALHVHGYGLFSNGYAMGASGPISVYGAMVTAAGAISVNNGMASVNKIGIGIYEVTYPVLTNPVPLVTAIHPLPGVTASVTDIDGGNATVVFWSQADDAPIDSDFYIEVKGQPSVLVPNIP